MSDERIYMLNVLWFKPDGGAERYREYLQAVGPISTRYGGKKLDSYIPEQAIIGELDADLIFIVEWPDIRSFEAFISDPEFQQVRHIREEAISNSLLIRCRSES